MGLTRGISILLILAGVFCYGAPSMGHAAGPRSSLLLFHWGPKDYVGHKLGLMKYDFQGRAHYGELSDGHAPGWDLGAWLNWARDRYYNQRGNNPYDGRGYQLGFTNGVGLYSSTDFLEYFRYKRNDPEDLLIVEIEYPEGRDPLANAPGPMPDVFAEAKSNPARRLGIEARLPLLANNPVNKSCVIYRIPDSRDGEIRMSFRPPNSSDVRRIWRMNSLTGEQALKFLGNLAEIMAPFNPGSRGTVLMAFKTRSVQIVFDRLYYDEGFAYLIQLLNSATEPFARGHIQWDLLRKIVASYRSHLKDGTEKRNALNASLSRHPELISCEEIMRGQKQ
jgi:hypothetical protein